MINGTKWGRGGGGGGEGRERGKRIGDDGLGDNGKRGLVMSVRYYLLFLCFIYPLKP